MKKMNLVEALTEDTWSELLSGLNIYTEGQPIFESTDYLQQILLDNVKHKRYKKAVKTESIVNGRRIEEWLLDGLHHREDGPVYSEWYENGNLKHQTWRIEGQLLRPCSNGLNPGPSAIWWYENGNKKNEEWRQNRQFHRDQDGPNKGPAWIRWYENGNKEYEEWYQNGKKYRDKESSAIGWYENGNKSFEKWYRSDGTNLRNVWYRPDGTKAREAWYQNVQKHREDGPAYTEWYNNGNKKYEVWYQNGQKHRDPDVGPAYTRWDEEGNKTMEAWYQNGRSDERAREGYPLELSSKQGQQVPSPR